MADYPMDLGEAKRRFEKSLALQGYSTQYGRGWRVRGGKKNIKDIYYLISIPCIKGLRGLLWLEEENQVPWHGSISLAVGDNGEWMITGGPIHRAENQTWSPPKFDDYKAEIEKGRTMILKWDLTPIDDAVAGLAVSAVADALTLNGSHHKANLLTKAYLRGEFSDASISEALSIIQYKWATSRSDRIMSALVWNRIFA